MSLMRIPYLFKPFEEGVIKEILDYTVGSGAPQSVGVGSLSDADKLIMELSGCSRVPYSVADIGLTAEGRTSRFLFCPLLSYSHDGCSGYVVVAAGYG